MFLFLLLFSLLNPFTKDLEIIKNDYKFLVKYYNYPFFIKNEKKFIKKLEGYDYLDKNSEPVYIKLLTELYLHYDQYDKIKNLEKKFGVVKDFDIYKYENTEYYHDLSIDVLKSFKHKKIKEIKDNEKGNYLLHTVCRFRNSSGIYLYNDITNKIYINKKPFEGNAFVLKNFKKNNYFTVDLKLNDKKDFINGIFYVKGADCRKDFKGKVIPVKVKKVKVKLTYQNRELHIPASKEEVEELVGRNDIESYYILYNFFVVNNLENEAYDYLKKWSESCDNYYVNKEKYEFFKEYIPNLLNTCEQKSKFKEKQVVLEPKNIKYSNFEYPEKIEKNEILLKEIFVVKENYYKQYVHYVIAIKDSFKFFDFFKISPSVDILGVYSIKNGKKTPIGTEYTDNEIFLKHIENNMILEIYMKIDSPNIIFVSEKYFDIVRFRINFEKGIKYKAVNTENLKVQGNEILNVSAYFPENYEADNIDFLPYFAIKEKENLPSMLKWYYFYKNVLKINVKEEIDKFSDIKKAYYYFQNNNKPLAFYKWSVIKKIKTSLLIFSLGRDIYGEKLFNYPIIKYKNKYLDLNLRGVSFGNIPEYLRNKEYISIDKRGFYKYHGKENILSGFTKENKVKINYNILEGLDFAEFILNITLNDYHAVNFKEFSAKYKDEEYRAYILESYLNKFIKNSSLIDYEIKETDNKVKIYIKGITKSPVYFTETDFGEYMEARNYFSKLFTPFFEDCPPLINYLTTEKRENPLKIKCTYSEALELEITLEDKEYSFFYEGKKTNRVIFKKSFFLAPGLIFPEEYKEFYDNIKNFLYKRKEFLTNLHLILNENER